MRKILIFITLSILAIALGGAQCPFLNLTPEQQDKLCELGTGVICDGLDVVEVDLCEHKFTQLERCDHACHMGQCVDCAPDAGTICQGDYVYSVDSCGNLQEQIETCASGCRLGACVGADCTTGPDTVCVGSNVYGADSCGNIREFRQLCPSGCEAGVCLDCTENADTVCYQGDIYNVDACQAIGTLAEDCAANCQVDGGTVGCTSGSCTPDSGVACFQGHIHWTDSCLNVQVDIQETCPNGCDTTSDTCLGCLPVPVGTACVGNDLHRLIGGCYGMAPQTAELLESCPHGCSQGACLPEGCRPNAGRACEGNELVAIDSCGVVGDIVESCPHGCEAGACQSEACTPNAGTICKSGDVTWVDSCDIPGEVKQSCGEAGCDDEGGTAMCVGGCDPAEQSTCVGAGGSWDAETCECTGGGTFSCTESCNEEVCAVYQGSTQAADCTMCWLYGDCSAEQYNLCYEHCSSSAPFSCPGMSLTFGSSTLGDCSGCAEEDTMTCYDFYMCGQYCAQP